MGHPVITSAARAPVRLTPKEERELERRDKVARRFKDAEEGGEAYSIALESTSNYLKFRGTHGSQVTHKAHALIVAFYYATKLISKRGKFLARKFRGAQGYLNGTSDFVMLAANPFMIADPRLLKAMREAKEQPEKLDANPHIAKLQTRARRYDRASKAVEIYGLAFLTAMFLFDARGNGRVGMKLLKENPNSSDGLRLVAMSASKFVASLYWFLRIVGSRAKNIEKLNPRIQNLPWVQGLADALSLMSSPWRTTLEVLERLPSRPENHGLGASVDVVDVTPVKSASPAKKDYDLAS